MNKEFLMSTMYENHQWWSSWTPHFYLVPICPFLFPSLSYLKALLSACQKAHPSGFPKCPFSVLPFLVSQMWPFFSLNSFYSLLNLFYALCLNHLWACPPYIPWSVSSSGAGIVPQYYLMSLTYRRYWIKISGVEI